MVAYTMLIGFLDPNDLPLLNENIEGEVFDIEYEEGIYRARVSSYDPFSGLFEVDSTGLDLHNDNGNWVPFVQNGVDLNTMFNNHQLSHLTSFLELDHIF